jgi:hypothetical protein
LQLCGQYGKLSYFYNLKKADVQDAGTEQHKEYLMPEKCVRSLYLQKPVFTDTVIVKAQRQSSK